MGAHQIRFLTTLTRRPRVQSSPRLTNFSPRLCKPVRLFVTFTFVFCTFVSLFKLAFQNCLATSSSGLYFRFCVVTTHIVDGHCRLNIHIFATAVCLATTPVDPKFVLLCCVTHFPRRRYTFSSTSSSLIHARISSSLSKVLCFASALVAQFCNILCGRVELY